MAAAGVPEVAALAMSALESAIQAVQQEGAEEYLARHCPQRAQQAQQGQGQAQQAQAGEQQQQQQEGEGEGEGEGGEQELQETDPVWDLDRCGCDCLVACDGLG